MSERLTFPLQRAALNVGRKPHRAFDDYTANPFTRTYRAKE